MAAIARRRLSGWAGPGDPGLMTARALELMAGADVIFHDRLIPPGALDGARVEAELIYVGKRPGCAQDGPQEEIDAPPGRGGPGGPERRATEGRRPVRLRPRRRGGRGPGRGRGAVRGRSGGHRRRCRAGLRRHPPDPPRGRLGGRLRDRPRGPRQGRDRCCSTGKRSPVFRHARPLPGRRAAARGRRAPGRGRRDPSEPAAAVERGTMAGQRTARDACRVARGGSAGLSPPPRSSPARWRRGASRSPGWSGAPSTGCAWSSPGRAPRPAASRRRCAGLAPRLSSCRRSGSSRGSIQREVRRRGELHSRVCAHLPDEPERRAALVRRALADEAGRDARALANATVAAIGPGTAAALAEHGIRADIVPERSVAEALSCPVAARPSRSPTAPC